MTPEGEALLKALRRPISKTVMAPALDREIIAYIEKIEAEVASLRKKAERKKK